METISRIQRVSGSTPEGEAQDKPLTTSERTSRHTGGIGRIVRIFIARRPRTALIIFLVVIGLVILAYMKLDGTSPEERAQKELAAVVAAVGELMILPDGDEPVLATVTDAEALTAQQAFFSGAVDGDQLLLFPKSLKAVIYSPSRNKIINAGPIEQQPATAGAQTSAERTPVPEQSSLRGAAQKNAESLRESATVSGTLTVEVRNGSGVTGKASEVAQSIAALPGFEAHATDATSNNYTKSTVVAIKNTDSTRAGASTLASAFGAAVIPTLPAAEKSSSADIVLILGSDSTQ